MLHRADSGDRNAAKIPFVSMAMQGGKPTLLVRLPLAVALQHFFAEDAQAIPVQAAKQVDGDKIVSYVQHMQERDVTQ